MLTPTAGRRRRVHALSRQISSRPFSPLAPETISTGIFNGDQGQCATVEICRGVLGNDWIRVARSPARTIKRYNGESQAWWPFLKVANDTAIAVNQVAAAQGRVCAYLETWHIDIESFSICAKNTRRRPPRAPMT